MRVVVPIGTRAEIVKLAPVVHLMRRRGFEVRVVCTGEDRDPLMAGIFSDRFGLAPDETWEPPSGEAEMAARLVELAFREIETRRPDCVLVTGSAYTVPIFCLAARRFGIPVVHCEAGLRSMDETSVEEANQKVAASTASLHLASTKTAARFLENEGVRTDRVRVVGNPVIDALRLCGVRRRSPATRSGIVVTDDRAAGADDPTRLWNLVDLLLRLADEFGSVTFPLQSETRARLVDSGDWPKLRESAVRLFPPLPFDGLVELVATSRVVVSDSGGLEEEASWLGVPVVVLRNSTPRWEGIGAGISTLVGLNADRAIEAVANFATEAEQDRVARAECPYGDGRSAERIASILSQRSTFELLDMNGPDLTGRQIDVLASGELLVGAAS
jgi:UDP-N-acetylglucosamine 2-epimerase (non-hydrolysing)